MAAPITQTFDQMALEFNDGTDVAPDWKKICGLIDIEITRTAEVERTETPADCDDESLPLQVEKSVRTIEVTVSGTGAWAQGSHTFLMDWFYSSSTKSVRLRNANAAVGATEYETGNAFLTNLSNTRQKGNKVQSSMTLEFDGTPVRTPKA